MYFEDKFTFSHDGHEFIAWEASDMHGPVSEWTRRDKKPGELILCSDRHCKRFYDFAAAVKMASKVWGSPDPAGAARKDFEHLRAWCNDDWHYVGVSVRLLDDDGEPVGDEDYAHACWGIESNCGEHLRMIATECAGEIAHELNKASLQREADAMSVGG